MKSIEKIDKCLLCDNNAEYLIIDMGLLLYSIVLVCNSHRKHYANKRSRFVRLIK